MLARSPGRCDLVNALGGGAAVNPLRIQADKLDGLLGVEHIREHKFRLNDPHEDEELVALAGLDLCVLDIWFIEVRVVIEILRYQEDVAKGSVRNENRSSPILDQA